MLVTGGSVYRIAHLIQFYRNATRLIVCPTDRADAKTLEELGLVNPDGTAQDETKMLSMVLSLRG